MFLYHLLLVAITLIASVHPELSPINNDSGSEITDEQSPAKTNELISIYDSKTPLDTCRGENEELLERLERLERIFNISQFNPDLDDLSLMELMYMSAKEKFLTSVPNTDEYCTFDFITGKCAPSCHCEFRPLLGDYTPSRMCRFIPKDKIDHACDLSKRGTPWVVKAAKSTKNLISFIANNVVKRIQEKAPPSDIECKFSIPSMECFPRNKCVLDYQFGDYSPHRSCRLKLDEEIEAKNSLHDTKEYASKQQMKRELVGSS